LGNAGAIADTKYAGNGTVHDKCCKELAEQHSAAEGFICQLN